MHVTGVAIYLTLGSSMKISLIFRQINLISISDYLSPFWAFSRHLSTSNLPLIYILLFKFTKLYKNFIFWY